MTPIEYAEIEFNKKYRNYMKRINEDFVKIKGNGLDWSKYCYIPIAGTITEIMSGRVYSVIPEDVYKDAAVMAALSGWNANNKKTITIDQFTEYRTGKEIYTDPFINIDNIFAKIGYGTFVENDFGLSKFTNENYDGVFLHIEDDVNENRLELRATFHVSNQNSYCVHTIHLLDGCSLHDCIADTLNFTKNQINKIRNQKIININDIDAISNKNTVVNAMYYLYDCVFTSLFYNINLK